MLVYESFRAWWFSKLSTYTAVTELNALENPPLPLQAFLEWQTEVDKEKQRIVDFRLTLPTAPTEFAFADVKGSENMISGATSESDITRKM